jgi:hypothetical protein
MLKMGLDTMDLTRSYIPKFPLKICHDICIWFLFWSVCFSSAVTVHRFYRHSTKNSHPNALQSSTSTCIPEHIRIDNVRPIPNDNWIVLSKQKANAKMLTHEEIKPLILEATRKIDKEIVDIQEVLSGLRMKIHQIALDEHMAFRHNFNKMQEEIYQASRVVIAIIQSRIEAEYDVTVQHTR